VNIVNYTSFEFYYLHNYQIPKRAMSEANISVSI